MIVLSKKKIVIFISIFMTIVFVIFINGVVYGESSEKTGSTVILDARTSVSPIGGAVSSSRSFRRRN